MKKPVQYKTERVTAKELFSLFSVLLSMDSGGWLLTEINNVSTSENDEVVFLRVSDDVVSTLAPATSHDVLSVFATRSLTLG